MNENVVTLVGDVERERYLKILNWMSDHLTQIEVVTGRIEKMGGERVRDDELKTMVLNEIDDVQASERQSFAIRVDVIFLERATMTKYVLEFGQTL